MQNKKNLAKNLLEQLTEEEKEELKTYQQISALTFLINKLKRKRVEMFNLLGEEPTSLPEFPMEESDANQEEEDSEKE